MPANELRSDLVDRVANGEVAGLFAHLCEEDRLVEKVAELFAKLRHVVGVDRLENFVRFLEDKWPQRGVRLLAIPRASTGGSQRAHDVDEPLEFVPNSFILVGVWDLGFGIWDSHEDPYASIGF